MKDPAHPRLLTWRYHAYSTRAEREATTDLEPVLSRSTDIIATTPTLLQDIATERQSASDMKDRLDKLNAMMTLYNEAKTNEDVEEWVWDELVKGYTGEDLYMLAKIVPRENWPTEIEGKWPNLVALANWRKEKTKETGTVFLRCGFDMI